MIVWTDDPSWLHAYVIEHDEDEDYPDACLVGMRKFWLNLPYLCTYHDARHNSTLDTFVGMDDVII